MSDSRTLFTCLRLSSSPTASLMAWIRPFLLIVLFDAPPAAGAFLLAMMFFLREISLAQRLAARRRANHTRRARQKKLNLSLEIAFCTHEVGEASRGCSRRARLAAPKSP